MKKWTDNLIELSREYLNYTDTRVKSLDEKFGNSHVQVARFINNRPMKLLGFKTPYQIFIAS